jgi:hypothetical protein
MRSAAHSEQHGVKGDSDGVAADCLTGLRHARVGDRTLQWSGVAAVTLMPAMARTAGHVTMLQRSPSYVITLPQRDDRHRAAADPADRVADRGTRRVNILGSGRSSRSACATRRWFGG